MKSLDVSYDVAEVDALTDARKLVSKLETEIVFNYPAWHKLSRVKEYLRVRQHEVLDAVLAAPEETAVIQ